MNGLAPERFYQERLEERLILGLARRHGLSPERAMDIYDHSKLADKVYNGVEGVRYLDDKVLIQVL